ncbi:MAG: DNA recombination protein RmuC [Bacteroidetes bacterium]|nr:DNA recombination protein RmuC [Bacteroidota bacterium]
MDFAFLFIGLLVGGLLAYLFLKSKNDSSLSAVNEKARIFEGEKDILKKERDDKQGEITRLMNELGIQQNEIANLNNKLTDKEKDIRQLNEKLTNDFKVLANQILEEKSARFTEQNKTNLDIILNPFKEKLIEFEKKVDQTYKTESAERITLKIEIKNLIELNKQISEEANNLATALKGDNKQQGNWGELVLEKILERSGLREGVEYKTQVTTTNVVGDKIKPDVVIFLPDEKHVIVDSKVSLVAYDACVNAPTEDERLKYLKLHIESLRSHVKLLSDKNYQTASGFESPDFILLFVPIESSFSLAVQGDGDLFNYAWDKKIVIVSPSTLLATLRTIASIWKQERQTRNAIEIAEEGGKLYDKFVAFYEDLERVGKKMDDAKKDYVEAMKKLYDGTGNLVRRAEKMKELGAKNTKQLPPSLIERASE